MIDDLLATGGTMLACCDLIRSLMGQIVGIAVLIELSFLEGRQRFPNIPVHSVIKIESEDKTVTADF
jgi:adenine phosphoribosyltransferase